MRATRTWQKFAIAAVALLVLGAITVATDAERSQFAVARSVRAAAGSGELGFSSCRQAAAITSGSAVPAWQMGAVRFLPAHLGVGVTAAAFSCFRHTTDGIEEMNITATPRLAVTVDGGHSWYVRGNPVPGARPKVGASSEEIVGNSLEDVSVLNSDGELFRSTDQGDSWQAEPQLARPVVQITDDGHSLLAVSAPRAGSSTRTVLERANGSVSGWTSLRLPKALARLSAPARLTVPSPGVLLLNTSGFSPANGQLYVSTNDGNSWRKIIEPGWYGNRCSTEPTQIAAANSRDWWILCVGGAAAGSSAKAVLETVNAGQSWHVTSAVKNLASPIRGPGVPRAEPDAFSAGSSSRLWLSLYNNLSESADSGITWQNMSSVDPEGATTTFDVLNPRTAYLLAPGSGLWGTTNGSTWHAIGALNTP